MADTERKKKKKPLLHDFVERLRKKEKAAKKAKEEDKKEDKKAKTKAASSKAPSKKKKKKYTPEDLTERELDIGSDRETKTIAERMKNFPKLSEKGKSEVFYDLSPRGLEVSNTIRSRRPDLPLLGKDPFTYLGPGKKNGGKVYSRGFRKPKYNG